MKITLDADRCQGHGRCFSLAPSLFDSDDYGQGFVLNGGEADASQAELARLAMDNCPEHAISIEE